MATSHSPKISVVIPFYNVESYIDECLKSVVSQSLQDIEIICVNDASTDQSATIVENYAAKDSRIICLANESNSGVSVARNKGLEVASGDFIHVIDSDDFYEPDAIEKLWSRAVESNADVVICDAYKYLNDGKREIYRCPHRHLPLHRWLGHTAWWFIFRRKIIEEHPDIRFPEGAQPNEDATFSFMLFSYACKHDYISEPLLNYRQHPNMCMEMIKSERKAAHQESISICIKRLQRFMKEHQDIPQARQDSYTALIADFVTEAYEYSSRTLSDLPRSVRMIILRKRFRDFLIKKKITNSGRLILKICKVPVFFKKMNPPG